MERCAYETLIGKFVKVVRLSPTLNALAIGHKLGYGDIDIDQAVDELANASEGRIYPCRFCPLNDTCPNFTRLKPQT